MGSGEPVTSVPGGWSRSVDHTLAALISGPSVQAGEGVRRLVVNSSALASLSGVEGLPPGTELSAEISRRGGGALSALTTLSAVLAATDVSGWSQWPGGAHFPAEALAVPRFLLPSQTFESLRQCFAGVDDGAVRVCAAAWIAASDELLEIGSRWRNATLESWDTLEPNISAAVEIADAVHRLDAAITEYAGWLRGVGERLDALARGVRTAATGLDDLAVERTTTIAQLRRTVPEALVGYIDGCERRAREIVANTYEAALGAAGGDR